jgi:hypothetical protein
VNRIGDEYPAWIGQGFDARSDIHPVAIEVVAVRNYVTEIDADAEFNTGIQWDVGVALRHLLLHLKCAPDSINNARKFHQHSVARGFDDPTVVLGDLPIDKFSTQGFEAFERTFLVRQQRGNSTVFSIG